MREGILRRRAGRLNFQNRAGRLFGVDPIEALESRVLLSAPAGWSPLLNTPPGSPSAIMQLSDGSVMIEYDPAGAGGNAKKTWAKLTPDASGSYINGTWTLLASANISRLDFASVMLPDGRVFTAGGEYGENNVSTTNAEIYDPLTNRWKLTAQPNLGNIYDAMTVTLPNGDVLVAPVQPAVSGATMIYHVATDTWDQAYRRIRHRNMNPLD